MRWTMTALKLGISLPVAWWLLYGGHEVSTPNPVLAGLVGYGVAKMIIAAGSRAARSIATSGRDATLPVLPPTTRRPMLAHRPEPQLRVCRRA